jgi:hypothetical protein
MIRSLLLFAHIVSVLALFVGLGLEWLSLDALRRATARVEALRWLRVSTVVPRFSGIALALTVASGFYLGARFGVLGDGWMRASYAALLLMAIVGGPWRARRCARFVKQPKLQATESCRRCGQPRLIRSCVCLCAFASPSTWPLST